MLEITWGSKLPLFLRWFERRPKRIPAGVAGTYSLCTIGCRLNQYEIEAVGARLESLGYREWAPLVGRTLHLLVERRRDHSTGHLVGFSNNCLRVLADGPDDWINRILPLRIERFEDDLAFATAA